MKPLMEYTALLKKTVQHLKNPYWRAKQRYIKFYDTLPIDEKAILVECQHGFSINGNMFYLLEYLTKTEAYNQFEIYVCVRGDTKRDIQNLLSDHGITSVEAVVISTDEYYRLLASAKYLFNDNTFLPFFIKKPGQIYTNTWHGTPVKTLGCKLESGRNDIGNTQKNFIVCDYLLVPNERMRDALIRDYMVENLSTTQLVYLGYPRNTTFFDKERQETLQETINPEGRKLYAYLPTFRGVAGNVGSKKSDIYLQYYLYELDKGLSEDELLYINIHPIERKNLDFKQYKHIRLFPKNIETYEMLSICDCLISDYSSVIFDYAVTARKIVLFPYDLEEYMENRGTYNSLDDFPFPQAFNVPQLLSELRSPKQYDDTAFLKAFAAYESQDAVEKLCNLAFWGQRTGIRIESPRHNEKENVLIYPGNLDQNGVTTAFINLIKNLDLEKKNYYVTFQTRKGALSDQERIIHNLPPEINYLPTKGDYNLTIKDRITRKLYKEGMIPASQYVKVFEKRLHQEQLRCYGNAHFDTVIHYSGYGYETIAFYSLFCGKRIIYVHTDMLSEIKTRGNQRRDVLHYAYNAYDKVAAVTSDVVDSAVALMETKKPIHVSRNLIDYQGVRDRSLDEITLDKTTDVFPGREAFFSAMESKKKKFISVGRFSPEKGHLRLIAAFHRYCQDHDDCCLIIMGGRDWKGEFKKLISYIKKLEMEDKVILLLRVSNPFPIINACDAFILSSFYEGFGLAIAEADILGLPVVSTDVVGPRGFLKEYNGTLVDNSEDGIYQGLCMLGDGQIAPMHIDYEAYNQAAVKEFEALFE